MALHPVDGRTMRDALALAPSAPGGFGAVPCDDWLSVPEAELAAMQAEALALFCQTGAPVARATASLALLHQLVITRAMVRSLGMPPAQARAAMRADHALGYLFGLASGSAGPTAGPQEERRVAGTLMMLHDLAYGREGAEAITAGLLADGAARVGEAFAEGMLAAAADFSALERWRRGAGGALPGGLVGGLGGSCWSGDGADGLPH